MDIAQRLDEIAMEAISDNSRPGLRAGSKAQQDERMADSLEKMAQLLGSELNGTELGKYASVAIYRANMYLAALLAYEDAIDEFLTELEISPTRRLGKAKIIRAALKKLRGGGNPLVALLVESGLNSAATLRASDSGLKGHEKEQELKDFAIRLYAERRWRSVAEASRQLVSKVLDESKRLECDLTEENGRRTLYEWLLKHEKETPSTS